MASLRSLITLAGLWTAFASAQVGPGQFTLTIYQPGSPLDGQVVNAANEAFWLGGGPATYCPLANQTLCPAGTQTIFAGMDALYVEVPGGQQVYVEAGGSLGFTQAHSASVPPGAYIGDFTNVTLKSDCSPPIYIFNWESPETSNGVVTRGILACPRENSTGTYQIYADTPAFNQTDCTRVDGLLPHYTPAGVVGAWQYI